MSATVYSFNNYHLGDNLIFLHLLRALAKQKVSRPFVHFCHACHIPQLQESVSDLPNILLVEFESPLWGQHKHEAINTWKNADGFWERSANRYDWSAFMLCHHAWTANRMGLQSPFTCREHLLLDYPTLIADDNFYGMAFLIGDSEPCSGQYREWQDHSKRPLDKFIAALIEHGHTVRLTSELKAEGYTITQIANIAQRYRNHIMVCNGPFWPTLSVHTNHSSGNRKRVVLLDQPERLNMPGIEQTGCAEELMGIAFTEGWL